MVRQALVLIHCNDLKYLRNFSWNTVCNGSLYTEENDSYLVSNG